MNILVLSGPQWVFYSDEISSNFLLKNSAAASLVNKILLDRFSLE